MSAGADQKITTAYVQLETRGSVAPGIERARGQTQALTREAKQLAEVQERTRRTANRGATEARQNVSVQITGTKHQTAAVLAMAAAQFVATKAGVDGLRKVMAVQNDMMRAQQAARSKPELLGQLRSGPNVRPGVDHDRESLLAAARLTKMRVEELRGETAQAVTKRVTQATQAVEEARKRAEEAKAQLEEAAKKRAALQTEIDRLEAARAEAEAAQSTWKQAKKDAKAAGLPEPAQPAAFGEGAKLGGAKNARNAIDKKIADVTEAQKQADAALTAAQATLATAGERKPGTDLSGLFSAFYKNKAEEARELYLTARQEDIFLAQSLKDLEKGKDRSILTAFSREVIAARQQEITAAQESILRNRAKSRNLQGENKETAQQQRLIRLNLKDAEEEARIRERLAQIARREVGSDLARRAAGAQVGADLREQTNDTWRQIVALQERDKYLNSDAGLAMLEEQKAAQKSLAANSVPGQLREQTAEFEKQAVALREREKFMRTPEGAAMLEKQRNAARDLASIKIYSDFRGQTEDIVRQTAELREREKFLKSSSGLQAIQAQRKAVEGMTAAQRAVRVADYGVGLGKFGRGLGEARERLISFRERLEAIGPTAQRVFAIGVGAIIGLGGVANPAVLDRFQWAVADLGAVIGRTLLPTLEAMTEGIREVADWFVMLDPETQRCVGRMITLGTALAGIALVGPIVAGGLMRIVGAIRAVAAAMLLLARNPLTTLIAGLAAFMVGFTAWKTGVLDGLLGIGDAADKVVGRLKGLNGDVVGNFGVQEWVPDENNPGVRVLRLKMIPDEDIARLLDQPALVVKANLNDEARRWLAVNRPDAFKKVADKLGMAEEIENLRGMAKTNPQKAGERLTAEPLYSREEMRNEHPFEMGKIADAILKNANWQPNELAELRKRFEPELQYVDPKRQKAPEESLTKAAGAIFGFGPSYGAAGRPAQFQSAEQFIKGLQIDLMRSPLTPEMIAAQKTADNTADMVDQLKQLNGKMNTPNPSPSAPPPMNTGGGRGTGGGMSSLMR